MTTQFYISYVGTEETVTSILRYGFFIHYISSNMSLCISHVLVRLSCVLDFNGVYSLLSLYTVSSICYFTSSDFSRSLHTKKIELGTSAVSQYPMDATCRVFGYFPADAVLLSG
ncbi:uncharacterized protein RJT20DRAFT_63799 [Scheffersomyces xylosifermentans]|uniref:uncharacterized protein n=1 Tax=Scheffersomyces xylosifermentans TaxID=1304137 RepID=UPI00315D8BD5